DPGPAFTDEPGHEADPPGADLVEGSDAGRGDLLAQALRVSAPVPAPIPVQRAFEALGERPADLGIEELRVVIAGDEHDRVARLQKADQRVLDPGILVEHGVEPLDRELDRILGAVADLHVPKVDEVAIDDQLPITLTRADL